jgi:TPR repeat protein
MEKRNVYEIFKSQSDRGNGYASWKLAMMHMSGRGCELSTRTAINYLVKSADQNSTLGRRDLAKASLRGLTRRLSVNAAWRELLNIMSMGVTTGLPVLMFESGRPNVCKSAAKQLKRTRFLRNTFDVRMFLAVNELLKGGLPLSKAELYAQLQELVNGKDEEASNLANRAMWLSDTFSYFHPRNNLVDTVNALLSQPDDESKIDAFELAHTLGDVCPNEVKVNSLKAVSLVAMRGNSHAKVISLCMALREAPEATRSTLVDQIIKLVEKQPELFNEHVAYAFRALQSQYSDFAEFILPTLQKIQRPGLLLAQDSLAAVLLKLGRDEEALPMIVELVNAGHTQNVSTCAGVHLKLFKQGKVDAETALFWAEVWQQDDIQEGLAAVTAVYEAMGAQSPEQKLFQYQVLEERVAQGDDEARVDLGLHLLDGKGVCIANRKRAFELFSAAAARDNARAMFHLGQCHIRGTGTHVDSDMGHYWISKAAAQGYSRANLQLAESRNSGKTKDGEEENQNTALESSQDSADTVEDSNAQGQVEALREVSRQIVDLAAFRLKAEAGKKVSGGSDASIEVEGA